MFSDREDAGKRLALKIQEEQLDQSNTIVFAVPRGGVVIGNEIAKMLKCKLDILISKKLTPPTQPEFAIGAVTHDGTVFLSPHWHKYVSQKELDKEIQQKKDEVLLRLQKFRKNTNFDIKDQNIILTDDGIATGSTILAIIRWISNMHPKKLILATPVMPARAYEILLDQVDKIIVLDMPETFSSVGEFYENFDQTSDDRVLSILESYGDP